MAFTAARIADFGGGRAKDTTEAKLGTPSSDLLRLPFAGPTVAAAAAAVRFAERFWRRFSALAAPVSRVPAVAFGVWLREFFATDFAACLVTSFSISIWVGLAEDDKPRLAAMAASRLAREVAMERSTFDTDFCGFFACDA